ncbi:MAG: Sec-independent protein translocase protein TatB [Tistlia sp.]|uniref:Sec-independent protein translocase protein TatB n=1 Tax=Tistlia sp. TaxID=3057121 RepID=UPI0034A4AB84
MLDIGWTEMAVIAFVALIVIGPKDLPTAMRGVAKWVRKARSLSREFQSGLDEMMRETELDEAKKSIESVRRYRVDDLVEKEVDPTGSVKRDLEEIEDEAQDRRTATAAPARSTPAADAAKKAGETGSGETESGGPGKSGNGTGKPAGAGRSVSHPAQMAPGNSVRPPAASGTAEASAKAPAPSPAASKPAASKPAASKPAASKPAAARTSAAKPASKPSASKSGATRTGSTRSGAGATKAAPKTKGTKPAGGGASGKSQGPGSGAAE